MKTVSRIDPIPRKQKKLRVAAYCRVSTDMDAQLESLEAQKSYYENYIGSRADWVLVGIYYDEGITGTKKDKRPDLLRMMEDCEAGKIGFVLTKSVSRFSRNTADCLELVRRLMELHIPIYFEKENLNTSEMEGEFLLSTLSSLAESESVSISENSKWSIQNRFQDGTYKLCSAPYGYRWDGKNLVVDPVQAKVVKRIFAEVLAGKGAGTIAADLNDDGIPAQRCDHWTSTSILGMLTNERYVGDALLQKTFTDEQFNRHRNTGEMDKAIIPKEIYMKVQEELVRRRNVQASPSGKKRMYSCTHCFSQMVVCGNCGEVFKRIHWNNHGCRSIVWRCASRLEQNGTVCNARTVNEKELEQAILKALNEMLGAKSTYKEQLQKNLMLVLRNDTTAQKDRIAERLLVLQQELLNRANNREAYDDVAEEIFHLRELQQQTDSDETTKAIQMERIKELQDFIGKQGNELTEFDEKLVKRWLRQITVWDDHYTVELKSGLSIDVPA